MTTKEEILHELKGVIKPITLKIAPLNDYKVLFTELGFDVEDMIGNGDSNGWEVDFTYPIDHELYGKYELSGSLWYGNYVLRVREDEEYNENDY
jgi:hypothetical protein